MIRVGLVDDHRITRSGIRHLLENSGNYHVVLEADNGLMLKKVLSDQNYIPDILILDITMPQMNGFETLEWLHHAYPHVKVIVFSLINESDTVINMISRGACSYISKNTDPLVLLEAIKKVFQNGFYLGDLVKKEYFDEIQTTKVKIGFQGKAILSKKEVEFIRLNCTNLSYKEIADRMQVKLKTIENYRDSLSQKLGISNRAALAIYGVKIGIVDIYSRNIQ